jgi:hypothetical protein
MSCSNNLKQISLGAHNYQSSMGQLPPGFLGRMPESTVGNYTGQEQLLGTLPFLLPYIEQDNVYRAMTSGSVPANLTNVNALNPPVPPGNPGGGWFNYNESWAAGQAKIKTFLCPSDATSSQADLAVGWLWTTGSACCYGSAWNTPATVSALGKTNYLGSAGYANFPTDANRGYFTNRSKTKIESSQDGSSNTIMFGEVTTNPAQAWAATQSPRLAWTWMSSPPVPTGWGGVLNVPQTDYFYSFSSSHPGIVMFAMGDGAVRSLRKPTHWPNIVWVAGINDGKVFDYSTVGN